MQAISVGTALMIYFLAVVPLFLFAVWRLGRGLNTYQPSRYDPDISSEKDKTHVPR